MGDWGRGREEGRGWHTKSHFEEEDLAFQEINITHPTADVEGEGLEKESHEPIAQVLLRLDLLFFEMFVDFGEESGDDGIGHRRVFVHLYKEKKKREERRSMLITRNNLSLPPLLVSHPLSFHK